jgi:hypothetical protein
MTPHALTFRHIDMPAAYRARMIGGELLIW